MKITTFSRANIRGLMKQIDIALKPIADQHGIQIRSRTGSFGMAIARVRLEISVLRDGAFETEDRLEFRMFCHRWGLTPAHLDKTFISGGHTYQITGGSRQSKRYPIRAKRLPDGKEFKFAAETVKEGLYDAEVQRLEPKA